MTHNSSTEAHEVRVQQFRKLMSLDTQAIHAALLERTTFEGPEHLATSLALGELLLAFEVTRGLVWDYESAITWGVTCIACSNQLGKLYEADMKAEVLGEALNYWTHEFEGTSDFCVAYDPQIGAECERRNEAPEHYTPKRVIADLGIS